MTKKAISKWKEETKEKMKQLEANKVEQMGTEEITQPLINAY